MSSEKEGREMRTRQKDIPFRQGGGIMRGYVATRLWWLGTGVLVICLLAGAGFLFPGMTVTADESQNDPNAREELVVSIQEIQGKPTNRPFSLNDDFIKQDGVVGVLTGFQVKYIGTVNSQESSDTYTWQYRFHNESDWTDFGSGLTYVNDEDTMGDYDVRLKATRDSKDYYSDTREVMVAEVECENFTMTNSSNYVRSGGASSPIITAPSVQLKVDGQVKIASGSPEPSNIKQGFIQGVKPDTHIRYEVVTWIVFWNPPDAPSGTSVAFPFAYVVLYANPPWVNDAPLNSYLYNGASPVALGESIELNDAPAVESFGINKSWVCLNGAVNCYYEIAKYKQWIDAKVWLVVVVENAENNRAHYIPLQTQAWQLHMDSTDTSKTTWQCEQLGSPGSPASQPTDGRDATSDDYSQGLYTWDIEMLIEYKP
jgi:hypothetical protein